LPPGYLISSIGWGWGGGCRGRSCLSIILRVGSSRGCRVGGRGILQSLRLLELLPVGVRPAKGGGGPGEAGHGSLHLDPGEGGAGHGGHQAEAGVHFVLFPLPGLDIVLLQCNWSRLAVNLLIKSTSVTNNVSSRCSSPERGLGCLTVCTTCSLSPGAGHPGVLGLDQGPVGAVHLVVQPARIAKIITRGVSTPERGVGHATVDTLPAILGLAGLLLAAGGLGE